MPPSAWIIAILTVSAKIPARATSVRSGYPLFMARYLHLTDSCNFTRPRNPDVIPVYSISLALDSAIYSPYVFFAVLSPVRTTQVTTRSRRRFSKLAVTACRVFGGYAAGLLTSVDYVSFRFGRRG
jgi:hypothetical protein